jgi:hypothetical protein
MKTKMGYFIKVIAIVIMMAMVGIGIPSSTKAKTLTDGYGVFAKAGNTTEAYSCGENIIVFVEYSTEEIDTGTHLYGDHHCINPVNDMIITSRSGSTYGQTFYVVDGVVGEHAEPC